MLRLSVAALLLSLSAGGFATAQDYSDTAHNFRLTLPDGWQTEKDSDKDIALVMVSPRNNDTQGGCAIIAETDEDTKNLAQAEIDAGLDGQFGTEFWQHSFGDSGNISGFTIETSGVETVNSVKRYFAVVKFDERSSGGETVTTRGRQAIAFIPGWHYVLVCSALAAKYDLDDADFKIVFASFAPLSSAPVAENTAAGPRSLTLYSRTGFSGVSQIVTQDTPRLALSGWHASAASVSVAGGGAWELCAGEEYRGRCAIVSAQHLSGLGPTTAILSARRAPQGHSSASLLVAAMKALQRSPTTH